MCIRDSYMVVSAIALLLTLPFLFLQAGIGIQVLIGGFCLAVFINQMCIRDSLSTGLLSYQQGDLK